jgi:hypothetical protein
MALFQIHAYSPFMVVSPSNLYGVETTALSNAMNHELMISLLKHVARRPPSLRIMFIRNIAVSLGVITVQLCMCLAITMEASHLTPELTASCNLDFMAQYLINHRGNFILPYLLGGGSLSPQHGASSGCGWRNGLQLWRLAADILNKQSWTDNKGWPSSLGVGRGVNNPSPRSTHLRLGLPSGLFPSGFPTNNL